MWLRRKNPRINNIRGFFLVKRLGKPILHYDTEFGKSILFAKRS
ncbi:MULTISPECIES: dehydrogenase [Streptococcus]|nr:MULTISPECIES: dehydrogenase [Streptococcus]